MIKASKSLCLVPLSLLLLAGVGCSSSGDDADDDGGSGGTGMSGSGGSSAGTGGSSSGSGGSGQTTCNTGLFFADEPNNYTFSSTLTLPSVTVKPNTELHFDWAGVTKDFLKHDLDPRADIKTVNVILWKLTEAQLAQKLNDDQLLSSDGAPPATVETMGTLTEADLLDFKTVNGQPIPEEELLAFFDPATYPPDTNTYTAIIADGGISADGRVRMLQSFKLDAASQNTTVTLTNTSTSLVYQTDLEALVATNVPAGSVTPEVDWGDLTKNAMGHDFLPQQITKVRISHYNETPAELEAKFLDLELIDTATYEADVPSGVNLSFSELKSESGATFPGIDGTGTWLLALFCSPAICRNPAPQYLTVLKPCN